MDRMTLKTRESRFSIRIGQYWNERGMNHAGHFERIVMLHLAMVHLAMVHRTMTHCRMVHLPTGAMIHCRGLGRRCWGLSCRNRRGLMHRVIHHLGGVGYPSSRCAQRN